MKLDLSIKIGPNSSAMILLGLMIITAALWYASVKAATIGQNLSGTSTYSQE